MATASEIQARDLIALRATTPRTERRLSRAERYMQILASMDSPTCDWYPPKSYDPAFVDLRKTALRNEAIRSKTAKGKGLTKAQARHVVSEDAAARKREDSRAHIERIMRSSPGASAAHRGTKSTFSLNDPDRVARETDAPRERLTDGRRHLVTVRKIDDGKR